MDIERRVQELLDRQAIADVIHAYCFHFDQNEPERVAELFTAECHGGLRARGGDDRGQRLDRRNDRDRPPAHVRRHEPSRLQHPADVRGRRHARGITYLYAWHRYVDGSPDGELWGRYHHRFERTSTGWKIAELVLTAAGAVDFHRSTMHPIGRR